MRNPVRKLMGVAVVGVLGALFALPMVGAGAQAVDPEPPGQCVILSVAPNPVPAFPSDVTVTGTAPDGVVLTLFRQTPPITGALVPIASQTVTGNAFSLTGNLPAASDISLNFTFGNQNAYTAGCATPGGEVVVRVDVEAANVVKPPAAAAAAQALAFTGSNDTPSFVLVGIAALVLGAVLVIAARRRSQLS